MIASPRPLMTPEELDAVAAGCAVGPSSEIAEAVTACYVPMRLAGYSIEQALLVCAGWLARAWGLPAVEEQAGALALRARLVEAEAVGRPP